MRDPNTSCRHYRCVCAVVLATAAFGVLAREPPQGQSLLSRVEFKPIPKSITGVGDAVQPSTAKIPDRPDLSRIVGPLIKNFGVLAGACPYPDSHGRLLWYRVDSAPDGARVARIEILRNLSSGASEIAYRAPGSGTTEANLSRHSGVIDPTPNSTTRGFTLRATDARGRSTLAHAPFTYRDPPAVGRNGHVLAVEHHRAVGLADRDRVTVRFALIGLGIRRVGLDSSLPRLAGTGDGPGIDGTVQGQSLPIRFDAARREFTARFEAGSFHVGLSGRGWLVVDVQGPPSCSNEVRWRPLRFEVGVGR